MAVRRMPRHGWLATLLAATAFTSAAGQPQVELHATVSPHRHLYAVELLERQGVAVGALGTILESGDGGLTWTDRSLPEPMALLAVAISGERALAVGQLGRVAVREAGEWQMLQAPTEERLLGVSLSGRGLAVAVGAFGTVLLSADGGRGWESVEVAWDELIETDYEPHLYDVQVDESDHITVAGEFGLVMRSEDRGRQWRLLHSGDESLFALRLAGDTFYAVGQEGTVLRSRDGGRSWTRLHTGVSANLLGIARGPVARQLLAPGMRSVLYSGDGGDSWHELSAGDFSRGWYGDAVWSAGTGGFLLVGHGGRVKHVRGINQGGFGQLP